MVLLHFKVGEFIAKAKKAEERAALAKDPKLKETWLMLAAGYRELAQLYRHGDEM